MIITYVIILIINTENKTHTNNYWNVFCFQCWFLFESTALFSSAWRTRSWGSVWLQVFFWWPQVRLHWQSWSFVYIWVWVQWQLCSGKLSRLSTSLHWKGTKLAVCHWESIERCCLSCAYSRCTIMRRISSPFVFLI